MIRSLLLLGAGTAAGWMAHRAVESGRRAAEQEAGLRVRETLDPTRLGRTAGQAVGDAAGEALATSARAFTDRLRADAPPWVSQLIAPVAEAAGRTTIPGEAVDAPADAAPRTTTDPSSRSRKDTNA